MGSTPRVLTFTSHFPIPSPMNVKGDLVNNWEFFKQQWQDYEVGTGLDKQEHKIRLATFRSAMGKDCLQIFLNLKLSSEQQQDINECIKALEACFKPKRNVVYERYLFNMCQQNLDETVDGYVNRLRKAASTCQFGTITEELIRDRLVIGLRDHATKLRLLKEDSLDINKALNICRSSEVATQQLKAMKSEEANRDNKDPWLSLLDYRNTPTAGMQTSPVQRLMSRRTKTLVPIATNLLYPEVPKGVPDKIQQKRQRAKSYHDRKVRVLPDVSPVHLARHTEAVPGKQELVYRSSPIGLT